MKKILSLLLALLVLISCVPAASAAEVPSVTVYLTVSKDTDFKTVNGKTLALYEISVPYFDLSLYGLEDFYYNPDCYAGGTKETQSAGTAQTAYGVITMLHLYIYATEVLYHGLDPAQAGKGWLADEGGWNGFSAGGDVAGSAYCEFWDYGNNANYYLNYEYPIGRPDWGASCDQVALKDGDIVSIRYTYYPNVYPNKEGIYHHFGESWLAVDQGERINLNLFISDCDFDNGRITYQLPVNTVANIYATKDKPPVSHATAAKIGTTASDGSFTLDTASLEPGLYYITADTWDPAVLVLEVMAVEPSVLYGDINGDGKINVSDAGMAYAIVKGSRQPTQEQVLAIDVDGNGKVNVSDAGRIYARVKQGAAIQFPAEQ